MSLRKLVRCGLIASCLLIISGYTFADELSAKETDQTPEGSGEATFVKNGVKETFYLQLGFFSDTRMKDPKNASIEFTRKVEKDEVANPSRMEVTVDASKIGTYSTTDGNTKIEYIAEGGQIFPPKEHCTIEITSPYTGTVDSVFSGKITDCLVHSAGIDNTVSIDFTMKGLSKR